MRVDEGLDDQGGAASGRFELTVEDQGRLGWVKMALYAALSALTFGAVELYPKIFVRVRDRLTGEEVVTQTWTSPGVAEEAVAQLREDLDRLTADEFWRRWSPRQQRP